MKKMMKIIDFRSDTVTKPTEEMRDAMLKAEVGDDVNCEDPTINKLEKLAAETFGKEAGLFMASGTMGNLVAVLTHTRHGQQVILDDLCHIMQYEGGGVSSIAGVMPNTFHSNGVYKKDLIAPFIIADDDVHHAQTGLICVEQTHNVAGGIVTPLENLREIYSFAKSFNIPVHMDGARIFNAAAFLNSNVSEIAENTDSLMFCLSKGLCAPVGSLLLGTKEFIHQARKNRKRVGGGMRQAGVLAACGIVALEKMTKRLSEDHMHLKILAEAIDKLPAFTVDLSRVQTNILMVDIVNPKISAYEMVDRLAEIGLLVYDMNPRRIRFVTHYHISISDIHETIQRLKTLSDSIS
jgi:threonine aldolase